MYHDWYLNSAARVEATIVRQTITVEKEHESAAFTVVRVIFYHRMAFDAQIGACIPEGIPCDLRHVLLFEEAHCVLAL